MELRQLQHFVAVAEEQHFTRAAQRINIVQSALSSSIRSLEEELDAKLFVRTTRQVRLTTAGKVFLDKARIALDAVREAREAVTEVSSLQRGTLGIGTVQSIPPFLDLPALLAVFHSQHPAIEVRLCQGSTALLIEKVRAGQLDLAILPLFDPPADIATKLIACDALVLICAQGHALAGRSNLSLAAIAHEAFVDFEPAWGTRRLVDRGFAEAGIERRTAFEVSDLDTLLDLVAHGLGVALVPEAIAEARRSSLSIVKLADPEICWELVVAHAVQGKAQNEVLDDAPRAFLDLLMAQGEWGASSEAAEISATAA
jgi:DNA-binding transcriptional LysR family regulator